VTSQGVRLIPPYFDALRDAFIQVATYFFGTNREHGERFRPRATRRVTSCAMFQRRFLFRLPAASGRSDEGERNQWEWHSPTSPTPTDLASPTNDVAFPVSESGHANIRIVAWHQEHPHAGHLPRPECAPSRIPPPLISLFGLWLGMLR
jgi:hypothetical protein